MERAENRDVEGTRSRQLASHGRTQKSGHRTTGCIPRVPGRDIPPSGDLRLTEGLVAEQQLDMLADGAAVVWVVKTTRHLRGLLGGRQLTPQQQGSRAASPPAAGIRTPPFETGRGRWTRCDTSAQVPNHQLPPPPGRADPVRGREVRGARGLDPVVQRWRDAAQPAIPPPMRLEGHRDSRGARARRRTTRMGGLSGQAHPDPGARATGQGRPRGYGSAQRRGDDRSHLG